MPGDGGYSAGSFTMGKAASEEGFSTEGPQHTVIISHPFAAGKFAVTVNQFAEFVKETGYDPGSKCWINEKGNKVEEQSGRSFRNPGFTQTGAYPAVCLNWYDAKAYAAWLAKKTGKSYRLLTEAEWEYAARGRTSSGSYPRFFFGDDEDDMCRYGNTADQTFMSKFGQGKNWSFFNCRDDYVYTAPAGSFQPNAFDLYDMHGNAYQWVEDCWHDNYQGAPTDGSAWRGSSPSTSFAAVHGRAIRVSPAWLPAATFPVTPETISTDSASRGRSHPERWISL
jgi:formylglycine-generating enzyme